MPQEPPHAIANSCKDEPWHAITCGEIPDILRAVAEDNFDEIDRAIVARLQQDGRIANVDLADAVSLSPSACLRRTKALEAAGVIAGYRAEVSRDALGQGLTVFIALRVDQHSRETSRLIEDSVAEIPGIVECHVISGEADFLLEAVVPDLTAYEQLLLDRVLAIGPVRDARSTFVIRTSRSRGPIPVDRLGRT
jgi:Lrp/AsnC family transcriptional regulator, leucine-responsive regulatory protein